MVAGAGAYTEAVDPFMHAARIRDYPSRCDRVLPLSRFPVDLAAGRLPTVVFVMPDLRHEMHSGPTRVADAWLRRLVGDLRASPVWRQHTRLVVTFDESSRHDVRSCCDRQGRAAASPPSWPDHGFPGVATRSPTPTTRCCARSRPPTVCRSSAMPATRPPPPSRRWPTAPGAPSELAVAPQAIVSGTERIRSARPGTPRSTRSQRPSRRTRYSAKAHGTPFARAGRKHP
jgi:hypothetical protein